jgi:hypothetical protein
MMKNFNEPLRAERPLLSKRQAQELQVRWDTIQSSFVGEPCGAVQNAHKLVASAMQQIEEAFADQIYQLENQWSRGDKYSEETSLEVLRVTLQQYRSFLSRLVSV